MLAFAAVHREINGVTIGAMEGFIAVEHGLNIVFAGRNISEMPRGITISVIVRNHDRLARSECIHVDAEKNLRLDREINLHTRFLRRVGGEQNEDSAVERLCAALFGERDGELRPIRWCRMRE